MNGPVLVKGDVPSGEVRLGDWTDFVATDASEKFEDGFAVLGFEGLPLGVRIVGETFGRRRLSFLRRCSLLNTTEDFVRFRVRGVYFRGVFRIRV